LAVPVGDDPGQGRDPDAEEDADPDAEEDGAAGGHGQHPAVAWSTVAPVPSVPTSRNSCVQVPTW
jgi:hypothetical protein